MAVVIADKRIARVSPSPRATPRTGRGVNFIKVHSLVPREGHFAIAAEAKKVGLPLNGHVPDAVRATEAVAAGQRTFEQLIGIFEASPTAYLQLPKLL